MVVRYHVLQWVTFKINGTTMQVTWVAVTCALHGPLTLSPIQTYGIHYQQQGILHTLPAAVACKFSKILFKDPHSSVGATTLLPCTHKCKTHTCLGNLYIKTTTVLCMVHVAVQTRVSKNSRATIHHKLQTDDL